MGTKLKYCSANFCKKFSMVLYLNLNPTPSWSTVMIRNFTMSITFVFTDPSVIFQVWVTVGDQCIQDLFIPVHMNKTSNFSDHMFLQQVSTIRSHDRGKRGYFGNTKVISYHLQLTRGTQPPGQLSLYLLNDINSL